MQEIKSNDRIGMFGRTGGGKTFAAKNYLLPCFDRTVFWDIKRQNNDWNDKKYKLVRSPNDLRDSLRNGSKKILYQYKPKSLEKKKDARDDITNDFDKMCEVIFNYGNTLLYVDEAMMISSSQSVEYWHKMLMVQGRGFGIGVINASQGPIGIHNSLISQCEHIYAWEMQMDGDYGKLAQFTGPDIYEARDLPEYHFLYWSQRKKCIEICAPVGSEGSIVGADGKVKVQKIEVKKEDNDDEWLNWFDFKLDDWI